MRPTSPRREAALTDLLFVHTERICECGTGNASTRIRHIPHAPVLRRPSRSASSRLASDDGSDLDHALVLVVDRSGVLGQQGNDEIRRLLGEVVDEDGDPFGVDRFERVQ